MGKASGARHQGRELALQFLFQRDFNREDIQVAMDDFWFERETSQAARAFADSLVMGVEDHFEEIDETIQEYAEHWDVKRMGAVDRNVMRIALYEMLYRDDIPPVVSINEAVDIAKDFSSRESGKFVNGILDRISKSLDRPARTSAARDSSKKES